MMIDERTVEQARNADLIAFLGKRYGFTFAHQSGTFRCEQHKSLAVKDDRHSWYWHSKSIGGYGALDFLIIAECMPFREAIGTLTGIAPATAPPQQPKPQKSLILPEKVGIPLRLYDYLCRKRGIDSDIVNMLIQKEMLYEDKRGNVVFVGFDECGKTRFASLRGTHGDCSFRMDCAGSDKRYGFNMAACTHNIRAYVFESAIDAMSHASLAIAEFGDKTAWEYDCRLSLAGTSDTAIPFFLNQHKSVKELVFCLDNDPAGREAAATMVRKYADKGYMTQIKLPKNKDFNEDLQAHINIKQIQAERRTNYRHRDVTI